MEYDVVIRNGSVVDGSGTGPRPADVAIRADRVVEVGEVRGDAARTIDATGRLVTPGFVDIHTHLDAQLWWDPIGSSSCFHGVTSVVLGNCGVTFAPCKRQDQRYLAELMESVEDIPADSIMEGLSWDWESYGEYLTSLEARPKGPNVGGMVGHCAVRYHAMGDRSLEEAPAEAADMAAMGDLVGEAMSAGALGFSTSRTLLHRVPDGRPVPGTWAGVDELRGIGDVLASAGAGLLESAPRFGGAEDLSEVEWMVDLSLASGRPVTFGVTQVNQRPELHRNVIEAAELGRARGADIRPQTTARGVGILFGLMHRTPWDRAPSWRELRRLDLDAKLTRLRDPVERARLVDEGDQAPTLDLSLVYVMADGDARYDHGPADSLAAHAARLGVSPVEAFIRLTLERDGLLLLNWPFLNQDLNAVEDMLRNPTVVLGLADAGAHVGQIMDASQPTFLLTYWVRERGAFTIGEAVRRLTSDTAGLFGIVDRGVLRPGAFADVNVIDFDGLRLHAPEYVHDFPGGAGRYTQRGEGYEATVVNGRVFMEACEPTGELAGTLLCP